MPFTVIRVQKGMPREQKERIAICIHNAMVDNLKIPRDDFFQMFAEYKPEIFFR